MTSVPGMMHLSAKEVEPISVLTEDVSLMHSIASDPHVTSVFGAAMSPTNWYCETSRHSSPIPLPPPGLNVDVENACSRLSNKFFASDSIAVHSTPSKRRKLESSPSNVVSFKDDPTKSGQLAAQVLIGAWEKSNELQMQTPDLKNILQHVATGKGLRKEGNKHEMQWERFFSAFKKYKIENNSSHVKKTYEAILEDGSSLKLGAWVKLQRALFRKGTLRSDRKRKLDAANFIWEIEHHCMPTYTWEQMYTYAVEFRMINGHCKPPVGTKTSEGWDIRKWISTQKKNAKLTDRKRKLLEFIGVKFTRKRKKLIEIPPEKVSVICKDGEDSTIDKSNIVVKVTTAISSSVGMKDTIPVAKATEFVHPS